MHRIPTTVHTPLYLGPALSSPAAAEEAAEGAMVAEQAAAWNAGDRTRYAAHLAPGCSFTNIFGIARYGAPAFAGRHRQILATFYRGTTKPHAARRIRFVTPDVAVVDIDNELHGVRAMPAGIAQRRPQVGRKALELASGDCRGRCT